MILLPWDRFSVLSDWVSPGPAAHALFIVVWAFPFGLTLPTYRAFQMIATCPVSSPPLLSFLACSQKCSHLTDDTSSVEAGMCQLHREMRLVISQASWHPGVCRDICHAEWSSWYLVPENCLPVPRLFPLGNKELSRELLVWYLQSALLTFSCSDPSRCGEQFQVNCVVHSMPLVLGSWGYVDTL